MYDTLLEKLNQINLQTIFTWIDEYISINEKRILDMARDRMKRGEGVNGGVIGYYRSASYEMFKRRENPLAKGNVDLFLTGALQEKMRLSKSGNASYYIYSTDEKYSMLADKYGANQFGITEEQHNELLGQVIDYVITKIMQCYE